MAISHEAIELLLNCLNVVKILLTLKNILS